MSLKTIKDVAADMRLELYWPKRKSTRKTGMARKGRIASPRGAGVLSMRRPFAGLSRPEGRVSIGVGPIANVHDKHPLPDLLHGQEQRVYGDCAYASQQALILRKAEDADPPEIK